MKSNPDETWQSRRAQELSTFLSKGLSGNWRALFTPRDREIFSTASGDALQRWKYEKSETW
jgi:hypothetical protein